MHDEQGDNPGQEIEGSTVSSINRPLQAPWSRSVKSDYRAGVSQSKETWLAASWRDTQRQSGLSQTVSHVKKGRAIEIPNKLLTPT